MKNVRSRLALLLYIIVLVIALFSLLLSAMARNGILFQRDPLRWAFFGFALKDVLLLLMAIAAIIALIRITTRSTTRPIRELSQAAQAIAQGDFDITVDIKRDNVEEYGELERSFNTMTAQLRSNEYLRKDFISNVSHELKTPLQNISGSAELLSNGLVKAEDVPKFAEQIFGESKRMITLVEDIIKLSHLDEGAEDMQRQSVDLYELADLTVRNLSPVAQAADIKLSLSGEKAVMEGIPQLLSGIIYNLCDNAIKYNRTGGSVNVDVKSAVKDVVLTISDTGIGIPPEAQDRIFERFYRVDKSRSKSVGGTGLGLSIVKHSVKLHGGEIELRSVVDKGTTIIITLPKEGKSE